MVSEITSVIRCPFCGRELMPEQEVPALFARCFGDFEIFWHGKPLHFHRRKSKELLAYLINKRGSFCSVEEIITDLWEDIKDQKLAKHHLRNLKGALINTLSSIGYEDLLIVKRSQLAIDINKLDCDYYRLLAHDPAAMQCFSGEYMSQYSWAEPTCGDLYFWLSSRQPPESS